MELNWLSASETDEWKHELNVIMCRKFLNVVNGQSPCLFYQLMLCMLIQTVACLLCICTGLF